MIIEVMTLICLFSASYGYASNTTLEHAPRLKVDKKPVMKGQAPLVGRCRTMNLCTVLNFCRNGGTCQYHNCQSICLCLPHFIGYRCQFTKENLSSSKTVPVLVRTTTSASTCAVVNRQSNNYNCSSSMYPCKHGVCVEELGNDKLGSIYMNCQCDPGWTGTYCDRCCDLQCGRMGQCILLKGTKQCRCKFGYTGQQCELNATTSTINTQSSQGKLMS